MLPYYIEVDFITKKEIKELEDMIVQSNFIAYDSVSGKKDGNLCWDMNIEKFNKFNLNSYTFFVAQDPNVNVIPHTDNPRWDRNTTLIVPLFWDETYAPCHFVNGPSIHTSTPYLFNTQLEHYINNNNRHRCNFQICFKESIEDVHRRLQIS